MKGTECFYHYVTQLLRSECCSDKDKTRGGEEKERRNKGKGQRSLCLLNHVLLKGDNYVERRGREGLGEGRKGKEEHSWEKRRGEATHGNEKKRKKGKL